MGPLNNSCKSCQDLILVYHVEVRCAKYDNVDQPPNVPALLFNIIIAPMNQRFCNIRRDIWRMVGHGNNG